MQRIPLLFATIVLQALPSLSASPVVQQASVPELEVPLIEDKAFIVQHADVPLYPAIAKTAHMSGRVTLRVSVKAGRVVGVETKSSSAGVMLAKAASDNVKTWQFSSDAEGLLEVTYVYELEKNGSEFPRNPHIEMRLPTFVKIIAAPPKPIYTPSASSGMN